VEKGLRKEQGEREQEPKEMSKGEGVRWSCRGEVVEGGAGGAGEQEGEEAGEERFS